MNELTKENRAALDAAEAELDKIERASVQPDLTVDQVFTSVYHWLNHDLATQEPPYQANSRKRDEWLWQFWRLEPLLSGVLNSIVLIDANRGWVLVGGRNQVSRYTRIMHGVENGKGWRHYSRLQALAFRTSDVGSIGEIERDGEEGPMRSLYFVDPSQCRLTGDVDNPLYYYPRNGNRQLWGAHQFYRLASMPSTKREEFQLGWCMVSRAVKLAQELIAVYRHDQEQMGARAPKGLLLLKGITEAQWDQAMKARTVELDGLERDYFGGVAILATSGIEQIDAKLIGLSSLPAGFDREMFVTLYMYGLALIAGYNPDEFWPVQGGSLGRGRESELQYRQATTKGQKDFALLTQEALQHGGLLPATLQFEYQERDVRGELEDAQVAKAKTDVVTAMYESGLSQGVGLLTREQALTLLAQEGLIPPEWTVTEEDVVVTDDDSESEASEQGASIEAKEPVTESRRSRRNRLDAIQLERERWEGRENIQRAAVQFPDEPIVLYSWPEDRTKVLWKRGRDFYVPAHYSVPLRPIRRQADDADVLFEDDDVTITVGDARRAIEQAGRRVDPEFAEVLAAEIMTQQEIEDNPVE